MANPSHRRQMAPILTPMAHPPKPLRAYPKRTTLERENDLVFISEHYLQGYSVPQITERINQSRPYNLTESTINRDIQVIHRRWVNSYLVDFDAAKAKELAHNDALEREYWTAWRESRKMSEIIDTEKVDDAYPSKRQTGNLPAYTRTKVRKRQKSSFGEPDFLQGIQWCIEQRCKIMGLLTYTQNINVSWRKQAEERGIDPDGVVDELYKQFVAAATAQGPMDGPGGSGSMG